MDKLSYSQPSPITEITTEHLNILENNVQWRKSILQRDYEAKQRDYKQKQTLYENRIKDFAKRCKIEKIARIEKNQARLDDFLLHANQFKASEYIKKLNFTESLKNRDKKKIFNMTKLKQIKQSKKQENDFNRYWAIFNKQKLTIEDNWNICIKHKPPVVRNVSLDSKKNEIKEVLPDQCPYIEKYNVEDKQKFDNSFRDKLLDRMKMLKMNFNTCEQGIAFWIKTKPLWNRLTQCLKESHPVVEIIEPKTESKQISEAYADKHIKNIKALDSMTKFIPMSSLVQQIMITDLNYQISDEFSIQTMKTAVSLLQSDATAADIIKLTRCILEHDSDVIGNVHSMLFGIIQRGAFEFMKTDTAKKIFVQARKVVDRLEHLNDKDIIPNKVKMSNNKDKVMRFVLKLMNNDERFAKFDKPFNDEEPYISQISETAADRMLNFLRHNHTDKHSAENLTDCFPLNCRDTVLESLDGLIGVFLKVSHTSIAHYIATSKSINIKDDGNGITKSRSITMMMVYRISRKIVKIQLEMFSSDERALHHFNETSDAFKEMIIKKAPIVHYDKRLYSMPEKVDLSNFLNLFDN